MSSSAPDEDEEPEDSEPDIFVDKGGRSWPAMSSAGDWPDYMALSGDVPFDKPKPEYSPVERRAELFQMIQQVGHPKNIEQTQSGLAERFGVSQQQISKDMQRLKEYIAAHDTTRAKSIVDLLAEKTVGKHLEAAERMEDAGRLDEAADRYQQALDTQMQFVEYLQETGDMDTAAEEVDVTVDGMKEQYMGMLREVSEQE